MFSSTCRFSDLCCICNREHFDMTEILSKLIIARNSFPIIEDDPRELFEEAAHVIAQQDQELSYWQRELDTATMVISAANKVMREIESLVDKIRYAGDAVTEKIYVRELLSKFDSESGDFKNGD